MGPLLSKTSTGLLRQPGSVGCMIPSSPSPPLWAPKPTASLVASSHAAPVRGLTPSAITSQTSPPEQAGTTSGNPWASALVTTSAASSPGHKVKVGIGGTASMSDPLVVKISKFRKFPAQIGLSGVVNALKARREAAFVIPSGILMGPTAGLSVALQSMIIRSSSTVTVTVISINSSRVIPSESAKSVAVQVPLGKRATAARERRSPCSLIWRIASKRLSAPYFSAIAFIRTSPVCTAET